MFHSRVSWAMLGLSFSAHAAAVGGMPGVPTLENEEVVSRMEFVVLPESPPVEAAPEPPLKEEVAPDEPEEPDPLPAPPELPEPPVEPVEGEPAEPVEQLEPSTEPDASEPQDARPIEAELAGITLGSDGGAWSTEAGSGRERHGPLRRGISRARLDTPRALAVAAPSPPPQKKELEVPLAELSRRPRPPSLGFALKRNYPKEARRQGKEGEAKVRARIEPSGEVLVARIASQSHPQFGEACKKTLLRSRWSKPIGPAGRPVATWVTYRCQFRVDD